MQDLLPGCLANFRLLHFPQRVCSWVDGNKCCVWGAVATGRYPWERFDSSAWKSKTGACYNYPKTVEVSRWCGAAVGVVAL